MQQRAASAWSFLVSKLRQCPNPAMLYKEFEAAGLSPECLLEARMISRAEHTKWRPRGCEGYCDPILDFETRHSEGLVGVMCPRADLWCWDGWDWAAAKDLETFTLTIQDALAQLASVNAMVPLTGSNFGSALPMGILRTRGKKFPVVWMEKVSDTDDLMLSALEKRLGDQGLVVLVGQAPWTLPVLRGRVAMTEFATDDIGRFRFGDALDLLDPGYRARRVDDGMALFDDVFLEFAEIPGQRHVVRINGKDYDGFRTSDIK